MLSARTLHRPTSTTIHRHCPGLSWTTPRCTASGRCPSGKTLFYFERRAGAIVAAFTETVTDPVLKAALALQGQEETRHANLIRVMVDRYGLDAPERPIEDLGADIETSFKDFGFGECFDLFVGFGLFKIAWQSEFLPREIMQIFSMLMYEETRHIVFFINWMA